MNVDRLVSFSLNDFEAKKGDFNEKFTQALKDGFFYVDIPEVCKPHLSKVVSLAEGIRENDFLKAAELGPYLGFQVRQGTQAVAFSAKSHQWKQVFSETVVQVAEIMNNLALNILKESLMQLSVPEEQWSKITGGLTDVEGVNVFSLNHYRPNEIKEDQCKKEIGLIPHKDMGWITVLFINQHGLEWYNKGDWVDVLPREGKFVINFGRAFEIFVNDSAKLNASLHRVRRVEKERTSFGIFINHNEGTSLYQRSVEGNIAKVQTFEEYLAQCMREFQELQMQFVGN